MDERSVTRPAPIPTAGIVADEAFCAQAAAVLGCDQEPVRDAFLGEPCEEVLEMVRWALSHQGDEGFDAARVLTDWAEKRGRGAWSGREGDAEALRVRVVLPAGFEEVGPDHRRRARGGEGDQVRPSRGGVASVAFKALQIVFNERKGA